MNPSRSIRSSNKRFQSIKFASVAVIICLGGASQALGQPVATEPAAAPHMHAGTSGHNAAYIEMMQPMHTMHESMSSLKSTGSPDKDFIILMLPHHQAAVDMAKAYMKHGQNDKLRKMAQEIVDSQEREIREMHDELKKLDGAGSTGQNSETTSTATPSHNH